MANEIYGFSKKYALDGEISVLLNKVKESKTEVAIEQISSFGLDFAGAIEEFEENEEENIKEIARNIYLRLNLPQKN